MSTSANFGRSTIDFLGHRISAGGVVPLPEKVEAIRQFPQPTSIKELQQFAGMIDFYHRFLPSVASIMHPLYSALKSKTLVWSSELSTAFVRAKDALANAAMLSFPHADAPIALTTDASESAVGAVLENFVQGSWQHLAFFSRQLRKPECKYSVFDRKLLALFFGCTTFPTLPRGTNVCDLH